MDVVAWQHEQQTANVMNCWLKYYTYIYTHTHIHTNIYIYTYIYKHVCIYACLFSKYVLFKKSNWCQSEQFVLRVCPLSLFPYPSLTHPFFFSCWNCLFIVFEWRVSWCWSVLMELCLQDVWAFLMYGGKMAFCGFEQRFSFGGEVQSTKLA